LVVCRPAPQALYHAILLQPTLPQYYLFNPGYAQVQTEHVWSQGWMDIIQNGMMPEAAAEKAFRRVEAILAITIRQKSTAIIWCR
jgi:hypothetical protein